MPIAMVSVLCALILSGCGGRPRPPIFTADQIFSNRAETWTFQNRLGDITRVEIIPHDANHTTWHYTKTAARAYWTPGLADAEIFFDLEKDKDGGWYSTGGFVLPFNQGYTVTQKNGENRPFLILPARADFSYSSLFDDVIPAGSGVLLTFPGVTWKTSSYMQLVNTPAYSGWAYVTDQWEGPCIHERWYFGPVMGMVQIEGVVVPGCEKSGSPYQADTVDDIRTFRIN